MNKKIISALGVFIGILFIIGMLNLPLSRAYNSGIYPGSTYTDQYYDLNSLSYYSHVDTEDGLLRLAIDQYLPSDGDNWTEYNQYLNGTNAWWYAGDTVSVNESRLNPFHYDLSVNDNYSTEIELADTGAGDFFSINFLTVDPALYDISDYTNLRWYFTLLTPSAIDNPLRLTNVTLYDNNSVAKTSTLLVNQSLTNSWQLIDVELADFFTDASFIPEGLTQINWTFTWDESMLEDNITILYDHVAFYQMEDSGYAVSKINPMGLGSLAVLYENVIAWSTNLNDTWVSISQDNSTWYNVTGAVVNGTTTNRITDNLLFKNLHVFINPLLPIYVKVNLVAGSTPYVDFLVVEYVDVSNIILFLQLYQEPIIIPNDTMSFLLWLVWGIGAVIFGYDLYTRKYLPYKRGTKQIEKVKSIIPPLLTFIILTVIVFSVNTILPAQFWNSVRTFFGYTLIG